MRAAIAVAAVVAASWVAALTARAGTITDTGQVAVDGAGNLIIGSDSTGSRTVDAGSDGPYASVTLGALASGSGQLTLDHDASDV